MPPAARSSPLTIPPSPDGVDLPVLGAAPSPLRTASAFDGQGFFLAWDSDMRGLDSGIAATRIAATGAVLDEVNVRVPLAGAFSPSVASGAGVFMMALDAGSAVSRDIRVVRFSAAGALLDQAPVPVNSFGGEGEAPAVAFDGTRFLVVWAQTTASTASLHGVRLMPSGVVVDVNPVQLVASFPSLGSRSPQLVYDGADFVLAWVQGSGLLRVVRVSPDLTVRDAPPISVGADAAEGAQTPALASDGDGFLVAWLQPNAAAGGPAVHAQRFAGDGMARAQPVIVDPAKTGAASVLSAAFDGTGYTLAWSRGPSGEEDAVIARVDASGALLGGAKLLADTGEQWGPTVAAGGGRNLVGWISDRSLRAIVLGSDGATLAPPTRVALSVAKETEPVVAANAAGFAVAWLDSRDGRAGPYAALLDGNAAPFGSAGIRLSDDPYLRGSGVALAAGGARYLVAWNANTYTQTTLRGRLIGGGVAAGPEVELSARNIREPAVAFGGGSYLVAGTYNYFTTGSQIEALRVSEAGAVLDPTPLVLGSASTLCGVASDGVGFLVAWSAGGLVGARVSVAGQVLDAAPRALSPAGASVTGAPALAFGAGVYLAAWQDSTANGIVAARVAPDGTLLDQTAIRVGANAAGVLTSLPAVAYDGMTFVVSWLSTSGTTLPLNREYRYATVTAQGVAGTAAVMATLDGRDLAPRELGLAGATGGRLLGAYQLLEHPLGYDVPRIHLRYVSPTPSPAGARCASAQGCVAGASCIDGVCCQSACGGGASDCQGCSLLVGAMQNGTCGPVADGFPCGTGGICAASACNVVTADAGTDVAARSDAADAREVAPSDATGEAPEARSAGADASAEPRDALAEAASGQDSRPGGVDAASDGKPGSGSNGCSCNLGSSPQSATWLLVLILVARRRRYRRRRADLCLALRRRL
jgi:hypothetical protein